MTTLRQFPQYQQAQSQRPWRNGHSVVDRSTQDLQLVPAHILVLVAASGGVSASGHINPRHYVLGFVSYVPHVQILILTLGYKQGLQL